MFLAENHFDLNKTDDKFYGKKSECKISNIVFESGEWNITYKLLLEDFQKSPLFVHRQKVLNIGYSQQ